MDARRFDDVTRSLAQPLPRRRVFGLMAAGLAGIAMPALAPARASAAPCPVRVPYPDHIPSSNGCGSAGFDVPDFYGNADFSIACNGHDLCYDTCNSNKARCDREFLDGLRRACADAYAVDSRNYRRCSGAASVYHQGVRSGGGPAYEAAQANACICCASGVCGAVCCDS